MATLGYRDPKADPVVRVTTYGGPRDAFVRVVDTAINFGLMQRMIVERVPSGARRRVDPDDGRRAVRATVPRESGEGERHMMHLDVFANVERRAPPGRLDFEPLSADAPAFERVRADIEAIRALVYDPPPARPVVHRRVQ